MSSCLVRLVEKSGVEKEMPGYFLLSLPYILSFMAQLPVVLSYRLSKKFSPPSRFPLCCESQRLAFNLSFLTALPVRIVANKRAEHSKQAN